MRLDERKKERLREWLESLPKEPPQCLCGLNVWRVPDTIFELREYFGGDVVISADQNIYPVIAMSCENCGHTHFINALIAGVLEPDEIEMGDLGNG